MESNSFLIKNIDKNYINLNNNQILEIFKISLGNNKINLQYNNNKNQSLNQNFEIIYNKQFIESNIGKMKYRKTENSKEIKILHNIFISNNIKRAKLIINNKQYDLKENIDSSIYKVKIKFFDDIIHLNSMLSDCKSLLFVDNLQHFNTKHLKTINFLFFRCTSLLYIDDISSWNLNNINYD